MLSGRIGLVKLDGITSGTSDGTLTLVPVNQIKSLSGNSTGQDQTTGALTIMKGTITMTDVTHGRLKMTWRIGGTLSGSSSNTATLTVTSPGGGY
ncbi:MAG TPA: hypothetical protein DF712_06950 [Balneola sp.]|nr:hypothetical protein [Balneola sp.]